MPSPTLPKQAGAFVGPASVGVMPAPIVPAARGPILPKRADTTVPSPILPRRPESAMSNPSSTWPKSATSPSGVILPFRPSASFQPLAPILPGALRSLHAIAQPMMALGAAVTLGRQMVTSVAGSLGRWMFGS